MYVFIFNSLSLLEFISGYDVSCSFKFFKTKSNKYYVFFLTFLVLLHMFHFILKAVIKSFHTFSGKGEGVQE